MKVAFIGGGKMAEAILHGVLSGKLAVPADISVGEPVPARRDYLTSQFGVNADADNLKTASGSDLVVLAVKPQDLGGVMGQLKGNLNADQAALSIVAGAKMETLSNGLGHDSVVRVMPNTPAQIGAGMTLWTCSDGVGDGSKELIKSVLGTIGQEIYVSDEKYMDMATALSASGPAYIFLFSEAMIAAGHDPLRVVCEHTHSRGMQFIARSSQGMRRSRSSGNNSLSEDQGGKPSGPQASVSPVDS